MAKLKELAEVIRSKNAGPFEITFDIIFQDPENYERVKKAGVLSRERMARLYRIPVESVLFFGYYDPALAIKSTIVRPRVSGGVGDTDIMACQQHGPLLDLEVSP